METEMVTEMENGMDKSVWIYLEESETDTAEPAVLYPEETQAAMADTDRVRQLLERMTLEQKAAQLFVITPEALTGVSDVVYAGPATRQAFVDALFIQDTEE